MKKFLEDCPYSIMDKNSLLMVISFQPLEEGIVGQALRRWKREKLGRTGTKKPLVPSEEEIEENSRSKSAKLHSFLFTNSEEE